VYVHKTGELLGAHSAKITGWGTQDGVPYWLVANSWGADWGENGYFKIARGDQNECMIQSNVCIGDAIPPQHVSQ